ncbi:MAG TPA: hypothetical protein VF054_00045 [Micromonosporaceae bacterium]
MRTTVAADALLGLLLPGWQAAIAVCVAVAVVIALYRLLQRGPSRMTRALLVTGSIAAGIAVIAALVSH